MSQPIDRAEVLRMAELASLELDDEEVLRLSRELGAILGYVAQLGEVDLAGVPPTAQVEMGALVLREDEPGESLGQERALAEAPRSENGAFAVPAFVDEG